MQVSHTKSKISEENNFIHKDIIQSFARLSFSVAIRVVVVSVDDVARLVIFFLGTHGDEEPSN